MVLGPLDDILKLDESLSFLTFSFVGLPNLELKMSNFRSNIGRYVIFPECIHIKVHNFSDVSINSRYLHFSLKFSDFFNFFEKRHFVDATKSSSG